MNKRIQQLAEQSGAGWDDKYHWYVGSEVMKRFAESIVRECMELCKNQEYDYWRSSEDQDFTPIDCSDAIREHFGVENDAY